MTHGAGGKVRARHHGHEVVDRGLGVVDEHAGGVDGLAQVVGRHVGGHAHGDARRTVHQQVGEARGEHTRLAQRLVVVGLPVDGVFVEVAQQLHGGLGQAALGVTHGGRGVTVDVAEVAVAVDQRHAHREPLGLAHHGVIDRGVSVAVVLADNFAHGPGRLLVGLVGEDARLVHGVEDAPVHGLEAVAHVGQGARRDDAHRVLDERLLHLLAELDHLELVRLSLKVAGRSAGASPSSSSSSSSATSSPVSSSALGIVRRERRNRRARRGPTARAGRRAAPRPRCCWFRQPLWALSIS